MADLEGPGREGPEPGLLEAFWAYERALMANDLPALDELFEPGPDTLRGDAAGILVGHEAIGAFRRGRGGAPARTIENVVVREVAEDAALVIAVTVPATGGRGQQTQLWRRRDGRWRVAVAHVSAPAPAIVGSVWRVVGAPLVAPTREGSLSGRSVAVKDLFAIAGQRVGAGVPAFLAESPVSERTAAAVQSLLDAGASVTGIARTDEFAYSIAGRNAHYGTPPNAAVMGGIPGGSTSGPASAVALGQADIALGTDTGGSIRVPASYQGLWGLRTSHDAVSREGLLPLAPSFDTVGWLARDAETLRAVAEASLDSGVQVPPARYVVDPATFALLDERERSAFDAVLDAVPAQPIELGDLAELLEAFRVVQAAEAWRSHGRWIAAHPGALGADVASRFAWAATIDADREDRARADWARERHRLDAALGDAILVLPSASSIAPQSTASAESIERTRAATMRLTCIAGLTGRPALSAPLVGVPVARALAPAPLGVCFVGARGTDLALIGHAETVATALAGGSKPVTSP